MRTKIIISAGVLIAGLAVAALAVPQASVAAVDKGTVQSVSPPVPPKRPELPANASPGKLMGTRKATTQEVASGFAASTASTVYICSGTAALDRVDHASGVVVNPDNKLGVKAAWVETLTSSGRPSAAINSGNAVFVFNNHTDSLYVYWSNAGWEQYFDFLEYNETTWYYPWSINNWVAPGGQRGLKVLTNGYTDQSTTVWKNTLVNGAGWRNSIGYHWNDALPVLKIRIWDNQRDHGANNDVIVHARGTSCGYLFQID